jgi:hypothetical protein
MMVLCNCENPDCRAFTTRCICEYVYCPTTCKTSLKKTSPYCSAHIEEAASAYAEGL